MSIRIPHAAEERAIDPWFKEERPVEGMDGVIMDGWSHRYMGIIWVL